MIPTLKCSPNINFKSAQSPSLKATVEAQGAQTIQISTKDENQKLTLGERFKKVKKGFTNVLKGFNNITSISTGAARGIVEGTVAAGAIGVIGKNCTPGKGITFGTIKGIAKDTWKAAKLAPKAVYNLFMKAPVENVKSLVKSSWQGIKSVAKGVKNHKLTTAIAVGVGVIIAAGRTIEGKVIANEKNANLDHHTNQGHIK